MAGKLSEELQISSDRELIDAKDALSISIYFLLPQKWAQSSEMQREIGKTGGKKQKPADFIAISNFWKEREYAEKLQRKVASEASEFEIRIEAEQSSLGSNATLIADSQCLLILCSSGYKNSCKSRFEATLASRLGKPTFFLQVEPGYSPSGWLAELRANRSSSPQFFDLSGQNFDSQSTRLSQEIRNKLKQLKELENQKRILSDRNQSHRDTSATHKTTCKRQKLTMKLENSLNKWTVRDVQIWLLEKDMEFLSAS